MSSTKNKKKIPAAGSSLKQGNLFSFFSKKGTSASSLPASSSSTAKAAASTNKKINKPPPTKKSLSLSQSQTTPSSSSSSSPSSSTKQQNVLSQSPNPSPQTSPDKKPNSRGNHNQWKEISLNCRIGVYWPDDDQYYDATVTKQRGSSSTFFLEYDDDTTEWLDLSTEDFKFLSTTAATKNNKNDSTKTTTTTTTTTTSGKRKCIQEEEDDDEFEFDEDPAESSDDDGSVYDPKTAPKEKDEDLDADDLDDDDDDQCMITDDEDSSKPSKKKGRKPAKKKLKTSSSSSLKVTSHVAPKLTATTTPLASTPPTTSSSLSQFANTVSPPQSGTGSSSSTISSISSLSKNKNGSTKPPPPNPRPEITPTKTPNKATTSASAPTTSSPTNNSGKPVKALPYVKGAVNDRGAHVHNHLNFLQDPRDASGKRPGEPGYDPRTLMVRESDWEKHCGPMTNAVKQWWDLKSQYFDTVLLFKTGKFYEMFHMDADVGVEVCGFNYMKGHTAHAGFPEISYGFFADKLVRAGYKVARVEQTETPEMLKERKQNTAKGKKKPQVINREVCSILTLGTRTFCALDDETALLNQESNGGNTNSSIGPLLAIREVLIPAELDSMDTDDNNNDEVKPVCEYGVTIVDAVRAVITIGQFADDVLRSRMDTLLATFGPSEILVQGTSGEPGDDDNGASPTLMSLLKSYQTTSRTSCRIETIQPNERFPKSTALDPAHRQQLERSGLQVHPWDVSETLDELHRRAYYPKGSRMAQKKSTSRWPKVLNAAVEGGADLCLSSFGAALFYLQRNLIDQEIMSMGIVKAYIPPASSCISESSQNTPVNIALEQSQQEEEQNELSSLGVGSSSNNPLQDIQQISSAEDHIKNMSLDGTTLHNLEILTNSVDHKVTGSLWSKINYTKSPHGSRLLRAWLLRPLFRKADIERRGDAVQDLAAGAGAVALNEARQLVLGKIGDLERLLSRVHSMSGTAGQGDDGESAGYHPNERAVLYETATYTKRKVGDFSKVLNGLRLSCQVPEIFSGMELRENGLLRKIVRPQSDGGCFPCMSEELDWFFDNFDTEKAAKGMFEPSRGMDELYDDACDTIDRIVRELNEYKDDMCDRLKPRHTVKSSWKYINTKPDSKDKYLIELPANIPVPDDFIVKAKRGSGAKQVNKYRTSAVERLVQELERAYEAQALRKAKGMQLIFAKFDSKRPLWAAAAHATAMLDALGSLAKTAGKPGFCRPTILDCPLGMEPTINIVQGRHPCVESSVHSTEFIPNDLCLGRASTTDSCRLLLLSGPNMGGKSTLLRQTCLIAILAQIGSYVPAEACELTPIDCIYTRLGASDRILLGQSTFFVELAETAVALRGATRRSLVIMDELGRGTSTFDGTAIAGATVKHLIERSKCISLFATHYHSLLDEWKDEPKVRLGHMQCVVEEDNDDDDDGDGTTADANTTGSSITFLYTLGPGTCPKSFGINVARLASLPAEVLTNAKRVSEEFEQNMNSAPAQGADAFAAATKEQIRKAIEANNWQELGRIWRQLQD